MESVALLTKEIWISTPLVLGIVVCVARRLISYRVTQSKPPDRIVHETPLTSREIVSYMGYGEGNRGRENEAVQRVCVSDVVRL